jgi:(p)ppGpp synthase/HD superfamily hydrolase
MHTFAQTNLQLFNQLPLDAYTSAQLRRVRAAYDLAAALVTGRFQASGKPLLAHLVGVASILTAFGARPSLVTAGLIHSIYRNGDFGFGRRGISDAKRRVVREAVGDEVEQYAARFATMPWGGSALSDIHGRLDALDALDSDVVFLRLADHLEHQLDFQMLYHGDLSRRDYMKPHEGLLVEIAEKLGYSPLANVMRDAHLRATLAHVPSELLGSRGASLLGPRSHRRRLALRLQDGLMGRVARWRTLMAHHGVR